MPTKTNSKLRKARGGAAPPSTDKHPLMRVLIGQATKRGESLATLAKQLGVSYVRLAQWRRGEADISNSRRNVLEAAARYLNVPTLLVLCMAGIIKLSDLSLPDFDRKSAQMARDLERMKLDPYFSCLIPEALASADSSVQQFVFLLWLEVSGESAADLDRIYRWMRTVELAATGHEEAQKELALIESQTSRFKRSPTG